MVRVFCCALAGITAAIVLPTTWVGAAEPEVVYQTDFEQPDWLEAHGGDQSGIAIEPAREGSPALAVESDAQRGVATRMVRIELPVESLRGTRIEVRGLVKAEDVAEPKNHWNGIKCMLVIESPAVREHPQAKIACGTFDWKQVGFRAAVPAAATKVTLALGLEQTTGKAWFDDVSVRVVARRRPATAHAGPVFKGHNHTRLRGAMIGPRLTEEDLRVLGGKWKANHVRWQLIWGGFPHGPGDKATVAEYEQWLDGQMDRLARFLPVCRELGVLVLIDMHTPPGGRDEENRCRMFAEAEFQQAFVRSWDRIARRFRNEKIVWGYDLVNEPVEGAVADGLMDWQALAEHTAKRVRAIDAEHAIIVEPAPWGSPGSLAHFDPLDVPGVVYSVHMYQPHHFTHQGVRDTPFGPTYPGVIDGKHWDKEQLREALRPAIEFQRDYGVHIYIGEFSAIRWAPNDSAYRYLRDVIELCEEYEWDWAYHAFREFDGWSVEHGADPKNRRPVTTPTTRERLLRSWFEKNQRAQAQFPIDRNADASRLVAVPRSRSLLSGRR